MNTTLTNLGEQKQSDLFRKVSRQVNPVISAIRKERAWCRKHCQVLPAFCHIPVKVVIIYHEEIMHLHCLAGSTHQWPETAS
jgi:hypothetical protein